ncbi:MAG: transglutaminase-like domain-containing protein [Candidatus Nanopelagicales bacterium]
MQALADILASSPYQEQVDSIENGLDSASLLDLVITSKKGTEAQFATAFAMMARSQGFPTRLVVGYAVPGKGPSRTVESTDVIVYPEVQFTKIGWVPFAPGPRDEARGRPGRAQGRLSNRSPNRPRRRLPPPRRRLPRARPPAEKPEEPSGVIQPPAAGWLPLLVLLVLLGWPVFVRWRRDRVRAGLRTGLSRRAGDGCLDLRATGVTTLGHSPLDPTVSAATYAAEPGDSSSAGANWPPRWRPPCTPPRVWSRPGPIGPGKRPELWWLPACVRRP